MSGPPWRCPISTGVRFPDRGRGRQKTARDIDIFGQLNKQGIILRASERSTAAEEIPEAYKDVADVVHILEGAGLGKIVARLVPLAVIKG
ncbi:MAG: hypothetical protein C0624_00360 [Desulfuromonas sp.]|nr:MAG: hypothetical protein C0624_00360 [Desulfuromonas sp.]